MSRRHGAPPVTLTFDIEDHRPSPSWEARYPALSRDLLGYLDERNIRATFFVVGEVAANAPELVAEIAAAGHELGLHSYRHWATFSYDPESFRREIGAGRALLEDLAGAPVTAYRAPAGTIMPRTYWATEVLAELGFTYSASVLPAQSYVVGFPGVPTTPFRWPSGLIEAPCPCVTLGPVGMPFLGGTFLRVLPMPLIRALQARLEPEAVPWSYLHPYDTDVLEPFWVVSDVSWWGSLLLWTNRGVALARLDRISRDGVGAPLGERLAAVADDLLVYDPTEVPTEVPVRSLAGVLARPGMVEGMAPDRALIEPFHAAPVVQRA